MTKITRNYAYFGLTFFRIAAAKSQAAENHRARTGICGCSALHVLVLVQLPKIKYVGLVVHSRYFTILIPLGTVTDLMIPDNKKLPVHVESAGMDISERLKAAEVSANADRFISRIAIT